MIDTVNGATSSAIIYSIAETAKANQLKPYEYFSRYLGSTVYIQKTTNKKTNEKALLNWFHSIQ